MPSASTAVWFCIGALLGRLFIGFARARPRLERMILGQGLVLAALIYVGFALVQADLQWIIIEAIGVIVFTVFAWRGIRDSSLWLAAGWGLHPFWDAGLHGWISGGHFVPQWYVVACLSFDLVVAAAIAWDARLGRRQNTASE